MYHRYAIFYTPEPGSAFAEFGARWLGWDSASGHALQPPMAEGLDVGSLTEIPRRYGFHATIKAPFRLADIAQEQDLRTALTQLAATLHAVPFGTLNLGYSHGFIALRPVPDHPALRALASDVVRNLDRFRAPLNADEIARRRRAPLSTRQDAQMLAWGYPYIFEDFQFHMTLSRQIAADEAEHVLHALKPFAARAMPGTPRLDALTLMGEDCDGWFHQILRVKLRSD